MKLLVLPRYSRSGASSRLRLHQYVPMLEEAGMQVTVSPLLGDSYIHALYDGGHAWRDVIAGYLRRITMQFRAGRFDVMWTEKEMLPWVPAIGERVAGHPAIVVDYDDAVFHRYDRHPNVIVRRLFGRKIDEVMERADLVTAGNSYLATRASSAGCGAIEVVPTVIDLQRYEVSPRRRRAGPLTIGWIGSPATAHYLRPLANVIDSLKDRHAIRAIAVGARPDQVEGTPFHAEPWSEESEAASVAGFDIGIMPLPDEPWERGKCGYKLIQYMACGLPVVASPVGVNAEIVRPGWNGELAGGTDEWAAAIERLLVDPERRFRMGANGRCRVEEWYSLQAQGPRVVSMLQDAASRRRR